MNEKKCIKPFFYECVNVCVFVSLPLYFFVFFFFFLFNFFPNIVVVVVCNTRCLFILLFMLTLGTTHTPIVHIKCIFLSLASSISSIFVSSQKLFRKCWNVLSGWCVCVHALMCAPRRHIIEMYLFWRNSMCVCTRCRHWFFLGSIRYDSIRLDLIFDSIE